MSINLTEAQIRELIRCYHDPIYFIENYCWIEIKEQSKIVPAKLYPYQRLMLEWLIAGKSGLVLKSRRVGASTVVAMWLGHKVNFQRGVNALLLSRNEDAAKKLLSKVKFSLLNLRRHTSDEFALAEDASWMVNTFTSNQQLLSVGWQDDQGNVVSTSEVASLTTTSESGRGDSATFVFIDEMAFLQDQEGASRSARLTTTRGGHWLAVSTPNGVGNAFHSLCMRAERNENRSYHYLKVHWSEADMTENMVSAAVEGMSEDSRLQEMELEFLSTGDPVFKHVHLAACYKPIDEYPEVAKELIEYRDKVRDSRGEFTYYSGVDSAVGKLSKKDSKRDYHSLSVLTKSGIQAFAYHDKQMTLTDWAGNVEQLPNVGMYHREGKVSKLHREFPGLMHVEINGPGQAVYLNHKLPDDIYSQIVAKQTNIKTKDQLIRQLIIAVESHAIIITDKFTYQCMSVFQRGTVAGTYSAPTGEYYDDPVISLALAWDALLSAGAIDFSWGQSTDRLERITATDEDREAFELSTMSYGPTAIKDISPGERMSSYFDGGGAIIIDSDLDIGRLTEPESMSMYG